MKIQQQSDTLCIGEVKELGAASAQTFKEEVRAAMSGNLQTIEVDLSQTKFVDSCGLGALIAVYKTASGRNEGVTLRLVNPTPPVQQIIELTRMHRIFEIVRR
jgi:anti-sigma B factor antagonist